MRCWRCNDRDERNDLGLCVQCREELHDERLIPPGDILFPKGTLPEDIGPYRIPHPSEYRTSPSGTAVSGI